MNDEIIERSSFFPHLFVIFVYFVVTWMDRGL